MIFRTKGGRPLSPLPTLRIERADPEADTFIMDDLRITLDGHEVRGLTKLTLELETMEANLCSISFIPGEVEVEAEVLAALEAIVQDQGEL